MLSKEKKKESGTLISPSRPVALVPWGLLTKAPANLFSPVLALYHPPLWIVPHFHIITAISH